MVWCPNRCTATVRASVHLGPARRNAGRGSGLRSPLTIPSPQDTIVAMHSADLHSPMAALLRSASTTHGVVSTTAAQRLGVTDMQLRTARAKGIWLRPQRGVLVASAAPATWAQQCMIAVVASGGVVSHRAAAMLHLLDGVSEAAVAVTVSRRVQPRACPAIVHRSTPWMTADLTVVDGIPVTSIARTLVDLGAVVEDDVVEQALDDALRRGVSLRWITETLARLDRPGPSGSASLRRVLARPDRAGPIPDSTFERLLERAVTDAGLPAPERQIEVRRADGSRLASIDAGWRELQFGLEAHSSRWHDGAGRGRADARRDRQLTAAGWELVYVTWWDLEHPEEFLADLTAAYHLRVARRSA